MRVLTAKWDTMERISPAEAVVTGADEEAEEPTPAEKPFFIYVTDAGMSEGPSDKIEGVVLDDNKVLVGMRFFKCVKMTPEQVADDPLLSGKSKDLRYFLFVSHDYEKVAVIDGKKMKASQVVKTMKKYAKKAYKTNFDKTVKAVLKLLVEYDKVNNARKQLEAKKGRDPSERELKEIEKELAELAEEQKGLEEKEKELLTLELRTA